MRAARPPSIGKSSKTDDKRQSLIRNVTVDEKLLDTSLAFTERLKWAAPILAPGEDTYASIDGRYLGKWGEPMKELG